MDELKIVLSTKFMRGIVAKIIRKALFKKTGYEFDVQINQIGVVTNDGKVNLHVDLDANVKNEDLMKIVTNIGLI